MKRLLRVLGVLVVVVALLVVADRVAVKIAENRAESAIEAGANPVTGVSLHVHGFPFLTQLAGGTLEHVTGTADTATLGGVSVTRISVDVHGMGMSAPYEVESGTATAVIPDATMTSLIREKTGLSDVEASAHDGDLRFTGSVLGQDLAVDLEPHVTDTGLTATVTQVSLGGLPISTDSLPSSVRGVLSDIDVPLDLPAGVTLRSATVNRYGIEIAVDGRDIALQGLFAS